MAQKHAFRFSRDDGFELAAVALGSSLHCMILLSPPGFTGLDSLGRFSPGPRGVADMRLRMLG